MIKALGVILLLYGLGGVIGSYVAYRALQGPIGKLKHELGVLAQRLASAGGSVKSAASILANKIKPALDGIAGEIGVIAHGVGEAAGFFGHEREQLEAFANFCRTLSLPLLPTTAVHHRTLDLDVSLNLVNGVSFSEYDVLGNTVYGPPMHVTTQPYTVLNLGNVPVVTGLGIQNVAPLEPVGAVFDVAATQMDGLDDWLADTKLQIEDSQQFVDHQAQATGDAAQQLDDLSTHLDTARDQLDHLSHSRLLDLAPLGVIGYLALTHLMFALAGVALLIV